MWIRRYKGSIASFLLAATVAGSFLGVEPAAAATGSPDLSVTLSAAPNPVLVNGAITYTIGVGNSSLEKCNSAYPEPICTFFGRAVNNATVSMSVPPGASVRSSTGDHNFSCSWTSTAVTCTGGSLAMDDWATLTLNVTAPGASGTISATATADPANAISERSETNNSASASVTVNPLPPKPDLVISNISGTSQAARGGQATYTATVANVGQAVANNVAVRFMVGRYDWSLVSSSGSAGLVPCQQSIDELHMSAFCPPSGGISLLPGQSATVTVTAQIPTTSLSGTWYTYAVADPNYVVPETNDNNNTSVLFATYVN
jgi:hypothetical protein